MDKIKDVFDEGVFYPGEGALAVTQDQIYGAMSAHKIGFALFPTTMVIIDSTGLTDYMRLSSNDQIRQIRFLAAAMIFKSTCQEYRWSYEAMKYLTGEEINIFRAENVSRLLQERLLKMQILIRIL